MKILSNDMYLLLIDEEAEIKENTNTFKEGFNGDWFWNSKYNSIQRTGDITEFDFKITAYYPLTKEANELDLPVLPNPFYKKIDVVALAIEKYGDGYGAIDQIDAFKEGYKAAQQSNKQFSLEDIKKAIEMARDISDGEDTFTAEDITGLTEVCTYDWGQTHSDEEIIQSITNQQLPKEFIHEYAYDPTSCLCDKKPCRCRMKVLKTRTNSEGKEELVGTWKF